MTIAAIELPVEPAPVPRWKRIGGLLARYLAGQIGVQAVNVIIGLAVIRWLDVREYAKFGAAFAFQCTIGMLIDLGVSNSIIALSGEQGQNATVVGGFIRAAQHYRDRLFLVMIVLASIAFPLLTTRQPWSLADRLGLLSAVIGYVYVQRSIMYSAPLLMHRQLRGYYRAQIGSAIVRLLGTALLWSCGLLTAVTAAWLATLTCGLLGYLYRNAATPYVRLPERPDPDYIRQLGRLIAPQIPVIAFHAFQAQLVVGIIAIFGSERTLAEVSALGRLGQLFVALNAATSVLIEPAMARVGRSRLLTRYLQFAGCATGVAAVIAIVATLMPWPLVALLGANYHGVTSDVHWVVTAACISYLSLVVCTLNGSRKYKFWWYAGVEIAFIICGQLLALHYIAVQTTAGALQFSVVTNLAVLLAHVVGGIGGLRIELRGDRKLANSGDKA